MDVAYASGGICVWLVKSRRGAKIRLELETNHVRGTCQGVEAGTTRWGKEKLIISGGVRIFDHVRTMII